MKYDFITIGGATEDITFYTKEGILINNKKDLVRQELLAFEFGAKVKVDKAYANFGGGATNTAICFSLLDFKVACLIAVGNDLRGEAVIKNLRDHNIDTSLIQKVKNIETGFSFLLVGPENEHIVFSNRAANNELRITNYELRNLKNCNWIYITSLSGKWQEVLRKIFSVQNVKIAWNPGHRQILTGLNNLAKYLLNTTVLIVNKDEAIELAVSAKRYQKRPKQFFNKVKNLLTILKSYGVKIVVITDGKKGAYTYDGRKFYFQPAIKERKRTDTTGVGDAFGSSFVAGLELFRGNIKKAMKSGALNTASVIGEPGAQNGLLTKKQIINKL